MSFSRNALLSLAADASKSGGRIFPEKQHKYRNDFQRDRDRIVYCKAFRRLEYKTQVFVNDEGDHYRTRLTHTIEVAQIARTIARVLGLNEDLCETIAFAHDLGHPPFGHAGQDTLNGLMKDKGGFEHNKQAIRIVEVLEKRYPQYEGLNLSRVSIMGLLKHRKFYSDSALPEQLSFNNVPLECDVVDFADSIAYNNHDLDDGLAGDYIHLDQLEEVDLWREHFLRIKKNYPDSRTQVQARFTIRNMINELTENLIENSIINLKNLQNKYSNWDDYIHADEKSEQVICFSVDMQEKVNHFKSFLHKNLYKHERVVRMGLKGQRIIDKLFHYFLDYPEALPQNFLQRFEDSKTNISKHRMISDYIAGMTDRYALQEYKSIFETTGGF